MGMDRFTRFQDQSLNLVVYLLILGAPVLVGWLVSYAVDMLLPDHLHIVLRTIIWGVGVVLALGLGLIIALLLSNLVERGVNGMRALYGLKPLTEAIKQFREQEDSATDERRSWFTGLNEQKQRYELFALLRTHGKQFESLNKLLTFLCAVGLVIMALLALVLWQR